MIREILLSLQFAKESMIDFQTDGPDLPVLNYAQISRWLNEVAAGYGRRIGNLVYRFCDDKAILKANREFLNHDYYTDIITFDYTIGTKVGADILISLDTVRSNAEQLNVSFSDELYRVIVHGLLHLCGLKDKTPEERTTMESAENEALRILRD